MIVLCNECSDPINPGEKTAKLNGELCHLGCATYADLRSDTDTDFEEIEHRERV